MVLGMQPPGRRSGQRSQERSLGASRGCPARSPHITPLLHSAEELGFPSGFSPPVLMLSVSLLSSISSLSARYLCHPVVRLAPTAPSICPPGASPRLARTASLPHPAGSELFPRPHPHLRGSAGCVSTAFRNWKSFRHQYFEVTL